MEPDIYLIPDKLATFRARRGGIGDKREREREIGDDHRNLLFIALGFELSSSKSLAPASLALALKSLKLTLCQFLPILPCRLVMFCIQV